MFTKKKYRLLGPKTVKVKGREVEVYRIQALIDIPLHNVKAGDLGGYVKNKGTLSHKGSCWISGEAIVCGNFDEAKVRDDALVADTAVLSGTATGNARIYGNAQVSGTFTGKADISGNVRVEQGYFSGQVTLKDNVKIMQGNITATSGKGVIISGDAVINCPSERIGDSLFDYNYFITLSEGELIEISGKVSLENVFIRGNCKLDGDFSLDSVSFKGDNTILGTPKVKPHVKFTGTNVISGNSVVPPGTHVHDVVLDSGVLDYSAGMTEQKSITGAIFTPPLPTVESSPVSNEYADIIAEIESEYEAYTTDIVKLIKYPAMVDTSVPEVGDFVVKLRSAKRAVKLNQQDRLPDVVSALEVAFVNAENKVQTLVASHLDEGKKKSLNTAEKMFALACDEASPEPEKRLGFKAGMRALEGIIPVSNSAVEQMKARVGILELEA